MERKVHIIYPTCFLWCCEKPTPSNAILPLCDQHCTQDYVESLAAEEDHRLSSIRKLRAANEPVTIWNILGHTRYKIFKYKHVPSSIIEGLHEDDFNLQFFNKCEKIGDTYRFRRVTPFGVMARPPPFALINRSEGKITNGVLIVPAEEKVQKVRKGGPSFRVKAGRIVKKKAAAKKIAKPEENVKAEPNIDMDVGVGVGVDVDVSVEAEPLADVQAKTNVKAVRTLDVKIEKIEP